MNQIAKNLKKINRQILKNAIGTPPTLVAVTKTRSIKEINEAISLGIKSIGENRVQEAEIKFQKISKKVEKRLVGRLQSNKIKKAISLFDSIDSVGSYVLAQKISNHCQEKGKTQRILIQINTSEEKTKSGFLLSEKKDILKCFSLPNLQIDGLMTIGPLSKDQNKRKKAFQSLKDFFSIVNKIISPEKQIKELSMGMSDDFLLATKEGSTMIRVGTNIFGTRKTSA
jgi:pyridoxal phosphate enzyme (YggS family)